MSGVGRPSRRRAARMAGGAFRHLASDSPALACCTSIQHDGATIEDVRARHRARCAPPSAKGRPARDGLYGITSPTDEVCMPTDWDLIIKIAGPLLGAVAG